MVLEGVSPHSGGPQTPSRAGKREKTEKSGKIIVSRLGELLNTQKNSDFLPPPGGVRGGPPGRGVLGGSLGGYLGGPRRGSQGGYLGGSRGGPYI